MNEEFEFQKWGSISRLFRPILITEKIDGTNAQVVVSDRGLVETADVEALNLPWIFCDDFALLAGSRKRYLTHEADNFGFHKWVSDHAGELVYLGEGRHYGEWWGSKIQRGYDIKEKRFSLFNVMRYALDPSMLPKCCHTVPLLYAGEFGEGYVQQVMEMLAREGSFAAPGYMNPEGIVIFHTHGKNLYKVTLNGDQHKSVTMEEKLEVLNENIQ